MSETDKEFVADMEWLHSHDREAALPPEKLARLFALARCGADAADEIERLKAELLERDAVWLPEKDAEIERLRAEVQTWVNHTKTAVWADSEECKLLAADNERLRAALRYALENGTTAVYGGDDDECGTYSCCGEVSYKPHENDCWTVKARTALKENGDE